MKSNHMVSRDPQASILNGAQNRVCCSLSHQGDHLAANGVFCRSHFPERIKSKRLCFYNTLGEGMNLHRENHL